MSLVRCDTDKSRFRGWYGEPGQTPKYVGVTTVLRRWWTPDDAYLAWTAQHVAHLQQLATKKEPYVRWEYVLVGAKCELCPVEKDPQELLGDSAYLRRYGYAQMHATSDRGTLGKRFLDECVSGAIVSPSPDDCATWLTNALEEGDFDGYAECRPWKCGFDDLIGHLCSCAKFFNENAFDVSDVEQTVKNDAFMYAGRYDARGKWEGSNVVFEVKFQGSDPAKSPQPKRRDVMQCAAYSHCLEEPHGSVLLYFGPGHYKVAVIPYKEQKDCFDRFVKEIDYYHWDRGEVPWDAKSVRLTPDDLHKRENTYV